MKREVIEAVADVMVVDDIKALPQVRSVFPTNLGTSKVMNKIRARQLGRSMAKELEAAYMTYMETIDDLQPEHQVRMTQLLLDALRPWQQCNEIQHLQVTCDASNNNELTKALGFLGVDVIWKTSYESTLTLFTVRPNDVQHETHKAASADVRSD